MHKQNIIAKDIIVIARQPAKDMNTLEIQSSLEHVLKIAKVFNKRSSRAGDLDEPKSNVTQPKDYILMLNNLLAF